MGNLMTSMYTGVSGMRLNQAALNTTAHNIANVDTKAFTRQQILSGDFSYVSVGQTHISSMQVGLGTDMQIIRQVRDIFADKGYRTESGRLEFYDQQKTMVNEIETVFGEMDKAPFKDTLTSMWEAMSALATEPDNIAKRGIVVSTAKVFLNRAQNISRQLKEYQQSLNTQIQEKVDKVNAIGDRILELNKQICRFEGSGQQANDYRDERNLLLDELSKIVKCNYEEDKYGLVTVTVEDVLFVSDDRVFHMETEPITTDYDKQQAEEINGYVEAIHTKLASGTTLNDIKVSDEWKALSKYGQLSLLEDTDKAGNKTGYTRIMFNEIQLMKYEDATGAVEDVLDYQPKGTGLLNVVWAGNGCGDVFKFTGEYNAQKQNDIGGLKGLLVARGFYQGNYTDIPQQPQPPKEPLQADYLDENGVLDQDKYDEAVAIYQKEKAEYDQNEKAYQEAYKNAVKDYNKYVDSSVLVATQVQFDQLIHSLVTKINDILCPNMELSEDKPSDIVDLFALDGKTITADQAKTATITMNGITYDLTDDIVILDKKNASTGMDEDKTVGEALFNRKSKDRYTEAKMIVDGQEIDVLVYNKEYETDPYSLFTIDQIEINNEIANDYSKIPLSYNEYSGLLGGFDMETCQKLLDAWDEKGLKLDPNVLTPHNYQDYYTFMISHLANRGSVYGDMVASQEDITNKFENARQTVAGVSSDDELTNLIKYQHAYNASSRYINAIGEMLEHIILRM